MADIMIGEVARRSGLKVPTIRYYEEVGLVAPSGRSGGNQRIYDEEAVRRLVFIAHARQLGFGLEEIGQLLTFADDPEQSCAEVDRIAKQHLKAVESRIKRLQSLKKELQHMIGSCRTGVVANCRIIERLADHGKCLSDEH